MPVDSKKILNIVVDQRFQQSAEGNVWTHVPPSYSFFELALEVFDLVRIIARTTSISVAAPTAQLVVGPRVEHVAVPSFVGPFQYLRRRGAIRESILQIARLDGSFLLRIPSHTGFLVAAELKRLNRPFGVELLTDPGDFFAPGVSPHGLAYLFRPYFCRKSRELCSQAHVTNFVTGNKTRNAHPVPNSVWSGSVSDVDLPVEAFLPIPAGRPSGKLRIVTVGFLDLLYKGQDLLIRALGKCNEEGLDFQLTFVGDGASRSRLLELAQELKIRDKVSITGPIGGAAEVRTYLGKSDLFVLPSRAEGIPRALIEAMAAGLPCICSDAGAMPDLLPPQWIVPAGSLDELAAKILEFSRCNSQWPMLAKENQDRARSFESSRLSPQRKEFYEALCHMNPDAETVEEMNYVA